MKDQPFLSCDVAKLLECTPANVRVLERTGKLKPIARTPNGTRIFNRQDVEAYAEQRRLRKEKGGR